MKSGCDNVDRTFDFEIRMEEGTGKEDSYPYIKSFLLSC